MAQPHIVPPSGAPPTFAREVLWTYRGRTEQTDEREFFEALDKTVADEISQRLRHNATIWVGREMYITIGPYTVQARVTNVEPLLATVASETTHIIAKYRERSNDEGQDISAFVSEVIRYPNPELGKSFDALVGLDEIKDDIFRKLILLLTPRYLDTWIAQSYPKNPPQSLIRVLRDRYPLLILEGEVGSGKTALARSIGHVLADQVHTELVLFIVNAQVRGGGHVGELTQNLSRAFNLAESCWEREQLPILILIDEADAIAQARGGSQTHHEDDAGVNTLIQLIDRLRGKPMAVIFVTNLVQSLDAAIVRRAVASYHFDRPDDEQRVKAFQRLLTPAGFRQEHIEQLAMLTEPRPLPGFGTTRHRYTYSDLSQRIIPNAVETAVYSQQRLNMEHLIEACKFVYPTPEMYPQYVDLQEHGEQNNE